jgi:superfamily II DNA or RNA helicase
MNGKFQLPFEIMTNDKMETARTGNWFNENSLVICRLDKLSRDENVREKLKATDWDLIVFDEAHKLSATVFGNKIETTARFRLGKDLSGRTRHFLLLTATPHNGKNTDFQQFMSLLDEDRFEGAIRNGREQSIDVTDLMRRMIKEDLLKFDGCPLFPERLTYTAEYKLSDLEMQLYQSVTNYVCEEFNRAESLTNGGQKGTVGFALTILQRRLASSPEAIYQSLKRRRERLKKRLAENPTNLQQDIPFFNNDEDIDDLDDMPEYEETEEQIVDLATAAQTVTELKTEIETLKKLENTALKLKQSHTDKKWDELSRLLQEQRELFDKNGNRHKLIIFTEHRDTLNYLQTQISSLFGKPNAVVVIHGAMRREERKFAETLFTQDDRTIVLLATDAAGEGINLQRAHLLINYDLPWNPNRLEQRFGRIHRIGQTEVCHCWNLVAAQTREGAVFRRLLSKLEEERKALGGKVFDVLGQLVFDEKPLRKLLLEAILYGEQDEVRNRMNQVVDAALDTDKLRELISKHSLTQDTMNSSKVREVREAMERAQARKLQPHFIAAFFIEAFKQLGGYIKEREPRRYQISFVPAEIRNRNRFLVERYERITFDKELINVIGKPNAAFITPDHPLLNTVIAVTLEKHGELLKQGTRLIDMTGNNSTEIRILVYLEHSIQDAVLNQNGQRRTVSRQMQFVEIAENGNVCNAGYAPYLDYRPATDEEQNTIQHKITKQLDNLFDNFQELALTYAITELVPKHRQEVITRREHWIDKTKKAVNQRLKSEIRYWDKQAILLQEQEKAGKPNAKLNSELAQQRADNLHYRLKKRLDKLEQERRLTSSSPEIVGAALIIPIRLINDSTNDKSIEISTFARNTKTNEQIAMQVVMEKERSLGFEPRDVSADKCGYDIESRDWTNQDAPLRFIEVKGREKGAATITITKNEILTALNKPEQWFLAVVEIDGNNTTVIYLQEPFHEKPDFSATSVNYNIKDLIANAKKIR